MGAKVGFMVGMALGAPTHDGPKLSDLRVGNSSVGMAIPLIYGTARVTGNLIWSTPFNQTQSGSSGKGGGQVNYNYTVNCAVAVRDGPIIGVRRIWINGKLWYSVPNIASQNNLNVPIGGIWVGYDGTTWTPPSSPPGSYTPYGISFTVTPQITATIDGVATDMLVQITNVSTKTFFVQVFHVFNGVKTDVGALINWEALAPGGISNAEIQASNAAQATNTAGTWMTFHLGSETQTPDTLIQAYEGDLGTAANFASAGAHTTGATSIPVGGVIVNTVHKSGHSIKYYHHTVNPTGALIANDQIKFAGDTHTYTILTGTNGPGTITLTSGLLSNIAAGAEVTVVGNSGTSNMTPGYQGTSYVVFQDFGLDISGNNLPNFEFEVVQGTTALSDIVSDICTRSGLTSGQLDVSQLAADTVSGYTIADRMSARDALTPLAHAYFFDAVETDNVIRFVKRSNATVAATIPEADLAAHDYGATVPEQLSVTRTQELELPLEITVKFPNTNANYLMGSQYARKVTSQSQLRQNVSIPIAMTDSQALLIAQTMVHAAWVNRDAIDFQVGMKYALLDPTDLVIVEKGANAYEVRLHDKEHAKPGIIKLKGVRDDVDLYGNAANPLIDTVIAPLQAQVDPGYIDAPMIFDAPAPATASGYELWIAACSANPNWGGCDVFFSTDDLNYTWIGRSFGSAIGSLTAPLASAADPDLTNTLSVDLLDPAATLSPCSAADLIALSNLAYVDSELVAYENAVLTGLQNYNLTTLRRGAYGSLPSAHLTGGVFVAIDKNVIKFPYLQKLIGTTVYFRFPSFNIKGGGSQDLTQVNPYTHIVGTVIGFPPNVTNFSAQQNGGVVVFKWTDVQDLSPLVYDIGYAPQGTSDWSRFEILTEAAKGTEMTNAAVPPGTWVFGIRAHDIANNLSPVIATFNLVVKDLNLSIIHDVEEVGWNGTLVGLKEHYTGLLIPDSQSTGSFYTGGTYTGWEWIDQWVVDPVTYIEYDTPVLDAGYDEQLRVWKTLGLVLGVGQTGTPEMQAFIDTWLTGAADPAVYTPWVIGTLYMRYIKGRISASITQGNLFMLTDYTLNVDMSPVTEVPPTNITVPGPNTVLTLFPAPFHYAPFVVPVVVSGGTSATASDFHQNGSGLWDGCIFHVWNGSTESGGVLTYTATGE